jgi:hypothetical protein
MISIILFFLANAIIFIYQGIEPKTAQNVNNQTEESTTIITNEKDNFVSQETSLPQENQSQINEISSPKKQEMIPQNPSQNLSSPTINQSPIMPNLSSVSSPESLQSQPLINQNPNNTYTPNINSNTSSNSYPDLATAVLSNSPPKNSPNNTQTIEKTTSSPPPISTNQNPPKSSSSNNSSSEITDLLYYVVIDYNGTEDLEKIQTIVPKAFLTNIGSKMKIHLGVFNNENQANELINKLKQQDIYPEILTKKKN